MSDDFESGDFGLAMALNASSTPHPLLDPDSVLREMGGFLGVRDAGDPSAFYATVFEAVRRVKEEAVSAKFREALMATTPSATMRGSFDRILAVINASSPADGINKIETFVMERTRMSSTLSALQQTHSDTVAQLTNMRLACEREQREVTALKQKIAAMRKRARRRNASPKPKR